jgi:hypothetical protein
MSTVIGYRKNKKKKMADTADLRSEGKNSQTQQAKYARLRAHGLELSGLCKYCGQTPVKNRKVCYDCSASQSDHTYRSGLRHFLKKYGVDLNGEVVLPRYAEIILMQLILEAQYANR